MVNNTAIAIVILNNRNLLVYFVFSGYRTKQARYSVVSLGLVTLRHTETGDAYHLQKPSGWKF